MPGDLTARLASLTEGAEGRTSSAGTRLSDPKKPQPITARSGSAPRPATTASGGGIASPLTETAGSRTVYADKVLTTTDGMLTWVIKPWHVITGTDANGATVQIILDNP